MNHYAEVLSSFLSAWKQFPDAPPSEYSTLEVHWDRHMPLTKVEVASFKLALLENSPPDYDRLFLGEPPCDPLLYPHGILIRLDIAKLNPIPCKDGVVTVDVLRKLRAWFARLGLPVKVAIQGDELHVRFRHLPGATVQCMADLDTDITIIGLNYRTAMRLQDLIRCLLPTLVEKLVVVK